jgi:hypothetical protein
MTWAKMPGSLRQHLLSSWRGVGPMFKSIEDFTEAWNSVREEVLPGFIARNPGSRPFAWWRVDHGLERPPIPASEWGEEITAEQMNGDRQTNRHWQTFGYLWNVDYLEPQGAYLQRHGLLLPAEDTRLAISLAAEAERSRVCHGESEL